MKTIRLTDEQMDKVLDSLDDITDGAFDYDVEVDDYTTVHVTGWLETDGYVEDDYHCGYMNGTGAYVETYRHASVELSATIYSEDGDATDAAIDSDQEKEADKRLNTAA